MKERLRQAYTQKPWRIQAQWIGLFLLVLSVSIVIIVLHLNITTQAAEAGVDIRVLEAEREYLEREINNNRTKLAIITSAAEMQKRAEDLGYVKASSADIEYIYVDEFLEREPQVNAYQSTFFHDDSVYIPAAYTKSIWDWMFTGTLFYLGRGGN